MRLFSALSIVLCLIFIHGCAGGKKEDNLPQGVTSLTTNNEGGLEIGNRYVLLNNEWNLKSALNPHYQCIFTGTDGGGGFFGWKWSWNNRNKQDILTYPEILCGDSLSWPKGHPADFPFRAGGKKVTVSFDITQSTKAENGSDAYDLAFDLWVISNTSSVESFNINDIKCEIMVWLDSSNSALKEYHNPADSMKANGLDFDYYFIPNQASLTAHDWYYAAFTARKSVFRSAGFDLTPFLGYLISNNIILPDDCICTVELGTEVAIGSGITVISNYSVKVTPR